MDRGRRRCKALSAVIVIEAGQQETGPERSRSYAQRWPKLAPFSKHKFGDSSHVFYFNI
jgi:hypothetical protein